MPLVSGTKLGPYEIQSPLGAGGMGEVFRANDERLDRDVTVTVLPAGTLTDENFRKRFRKFAVAIFCSANYRCG
jgi:eukaryotic-like serine/threonine-protein kinase